MDKYFSCKTITVLLLWCYSISSLSSQNKTVEGAGDIAAFALPVATLATTFIMDDKKGSWQFAKGLLLTQAVTYGLKLGTNKYRPDMSNRLSFPSGHTSTTFQSAAFIHNRYGLKYSIPAYVLAGFTGFSRIDAEKHDGWDVLVGALIGVGSSFLFTTRYQKEHMQLTFNSVQGDYLLGLTIKL